MRLSHLGFALLLVPGCDDGDSAKSDAAAAECRGIGNYQAGKEGSYRPCCEGLHEQLQQLRATDGSGDEVCIDVPLRVYACVEGSCGDGRCEEPEAVPCGCPADCVGSVLRGP